MFASKLVEQSSNINDYEYFGEEWKLNGKWKLSFLCV